MRLGSTAWPHSLHGTVPLESAIGCSNGTCASRCFRPSLLCLPDLFFGPCRRANPPLRPLPVFEIVFVCTIYHQIRVLASNNVCSLQFFHFPPPLQSFKAGFAANKASLMTDAVTADGCLLRFRHHPSAYFTSKARETVALLTRC